MEAPGRAARQIDLRRFVVRDFLDFDLAGRRRSEIIDNMLSIAVATAMVKPLASLLVSVKPALT